MAPRTGQYILHCVERNVIKMARTIKCLPDHAKWNPADIEAVRASPFDLANVTEPGVVLQERPAKEGDVDQPKKKPTNRKI